MMGDLSPQEKLCSNCGEFKAIRECFDRDASKPDGYKNICRDCRRAKLAARKDQDILNATRALDRRIAAILADAKAGGTDIPHIAELYQVLMRGYGGLEGFVAHYLGTYVASNPGSQTRERMLGNILKMASAVSDSKKVELPAELMSDQDLERELEARGGTSRIILSQAKPVFPDPPDDEDEPDVEPDSDPFGDDDGS